MKKIIFLLLLFVISCHTPPPSYVQHNGNIRIAPIYLDSNWNDQERTALKKAVDNWNWALNNELILEVKDEHYHVNWPEHSDHLYENDPGYLLIKVSEKDRIVTEDEGLILAYAWTNARGGNRIYFIRDRLLSREISFRTYVHTPWDMDDLTYIAMHEIGHALGAKHVEYQGIMEPEYTKQDYTCIDRTAVILVAAYQHLPTDDLRYCTHQ